jgi:DNA-binding response OmpR family regulator
MSGGHVLLIEPDKILAEIYQASIEGAGFTVSWATTAQGALDVADIKCPDVVVLELQLVAHGGLEFAYEFRSYVDWSRVPIIVHSHIPVRELSSCEALREHVGIGTFLHKSTTSLAQLVDAISSAVRAQQPI